MTNTIQNMTLKIDKEYQALIPPLTAEEFAQLESNILRDGCTYPIITWEETIIDGHNRYAICKEHGIDFKIITMEFLDRSHAREWIIRNQFGRRNLPPYVKVSLALELESTIAARAKENQVERKGEQAGATLTNSSNLTPVNTRAELAKTAGVSEDTVAKVKTIKAKASDETKDKLAKGEISINKAYQETKQKEEPETTVVNDVKEKSLASIKIKECNGMSIFTSAKMVMQRLDDKDEEFTQSLDSMIAYCQKRITNRK